MKSFNLLVVSKRAFEKRLGVLTGESNANRALRRDLSFDEKSGDEHMTDGTLGSLPSEALESFAGLGTLGPISSPLVIAGKSGVRHSFTLGIGSQGDIDVACDMVVGSRPADETKVLSLFIKVYDTGAKHAVLCVVPSLTAEAKKLLDVYQILVVEAATVEDAQARLAVVLRQISKSK